MYLAPPNLKTCLRAQVYFSLLETVLRECLTFMFFHR